MMAYANGLDVLMSDASDGTVIVARASALGSIAFLLDVKG